jgi:hypothetical protein
VALALVAVFLCLVQGGCAGALLIPSGMSALEASTMGVKALESGSAVWSKRTLASDEAATFEDTLSAVDRALNRLAFTRDRTIVRDAEAKFYCSERDKGIEVRLRERTPRVTKVKIRVGLWGDQSLSLLMLNAIKLELSRDAHDPGEGAPAPPPPPPPEEPDSP